MYLKTQIENLLRLAKAQEAIEPYYEVLEYVRGVNNSTFLTDFYPTNNTRVEFRALNIDSTSFESSSRWFIGTRTAFLSKQFGFYFNLDSPTKLFYSLNNKQDSVNYTTTQMYGDHTFMMDSTGLYIDGTKVITSSITGSFACEYPLAIGGLNNGGGLTIPARCDYTYFKIWESNVLVHDYIPALNNKMQPCLYDRVTKTFLNAITRDTKEPIYELSFKRWNKYDVDYIASDGSQYVTTSIYPDQNTSIEVCASTSAWGYVPLTSDSRSTNIFGAGSASATDSYTFGICNKSSDTTGRRGGVAITGMTGSLNTKYVLYQDNSGASYNDNALTYGNTPPNIKATTNPLTFFRNPLSGVSGQVSLYYAKVWQSNNLILSFKPSVRTYNDGTSVVTKAFLYDEVYNKAYDNAGTGSFKAYITNISTTKTNVFTTTGATSGKAINAEGQIITSSASSYSALLPIVGGTVIECVSGDIGNNNYRFHTYDSNGNWIEQSLLLFAEGTGTVTPATGSFTAPINAKYVRVSYATSASSTIQVKSATETIYEVGKAIKFPANSGFTLDAPDSSNFILDLLTRATTTNSYYMLDTRYQASSSNEEEFGIGGSAQNSTVNWKCEGETILIKTNGTNWSRSSNYTYSHMLVGYKEGNTFKRTSSFYDFDNQKTSDVTVVTASRDIANNTKPLTILHTTSSNWLGNGAEINYFKYLQDDNDVWYDCIPVRNATLTSSVMLFDRANNTSLPKTGSGTPTFVALD